MDRMEIRTRHNNTKEYVTIELLMNGEALGHIHLDASSAEKYIHDLALHRSALVDQVPAELDPGSRLEALVDPIWKIPDHKTPHGRVLALRHPGLGWLSFVFPDKEAVQIAEWLTKDLPSKSLDI